ncbi:hypothetical protein PR048_002697 [Dryococelus australis]|uniref:Uncharacterized protein n=1 Tax=Dryococelus australis TaxID=614101 RepID=A0ABQ9ILZ5_9NEOP|nr:hypothetical protein PR048_002697 [Dryococelus australis]
MSEEISVPLNSEVLRADRNRRAGKMGDCRENPSISGIVRHDSHMRKSGSDIAREMSMEVNLIASSQAHIGDTQGSFVCKYKRGEFTMRPTPFLSTQAYSTKLGRRQLEPSYRPSALLRDRPGTPGWEQQATNRPKDNSSDYTTKTQ